MSIVNINKPVEENINLWGNQKRINMSYSPSNTVGGTVEIRLLPPSGLALVVPATITASNNASHWVFDCSAVPNGSYQYELTVRMPSDDHDTWLAKGKLQVGVK